MFQQQPAPAKDDVATNQQKALGIFLPNKKYSLQFVIVFLKQPLLLISTTNFSNISAINLLFIKCLDNYRNRKLGFFVQNLKNASRAIFRYAFIWD